MKNFRGAVEVLSPVRHLQVSGLQAGHGNGVNVPLRVGWTKPLISPFWLNDCLENIGEDLPNFCWQLWQAGFRGFKLMDLNSNGCFAGGHLLDVY